MSGPIDGIGILAPRGIPGPFYLLLALKVFGFILHMIFMNLVYAGWFIAIVFRHSSKPWLSVAGTRLIRRMPVIMAYAVNTGIVPLLFLQAVYYHWFYTATILMAWSWFLIIPLILTCYTGIYIYVRQMDNASKRKSRFVSLIGWGSAIGFFIIGHLFVHGLSLMTRVDAWPGLFHLQEIGGAVTGTAMNFSDPTLIPRWFLMITLAFMTTGVYFCADAHFGMCYGEEDRRRLVNVAGILYGAGLMGFAIAGSIYIFHSLDPSIRQVLLQSRRMLMLMTATAVSPGLPFVFYSLYRIKPETKRLVMVITGQILVISLNAISRQVVQYFEIVRYVSTERFDVTSFSLLSVFIFIILAVIGAICLGWILRRVYREVKGFA